MVKLRRRELVGGLALAATAAGLRIPVRAARAAETAADVEKAKAEGKVVLYTSLDTKIVDAIIAPFKEAHGISVEYYRGGSADVTSKVLAEADAGRLQADMVDASDVGAFLAMKARNLLEPYQSPATRTVPANLRDPDFAWVADRLTQAIIQFNTKEFGGKDAPQHWSDLADPRFKGRLAFFSSSNGDGAPRLYTLAKALGWDLLEKYAKNEPLRVQTPQLITQVLETGERGAGFCQNDNIAWRSKQQGKPTDYVYSDEGVPTELGGVGLDRRLRSPQCRQALLRLVDGQGGSGAARQGRQVFQPHRRRPAHRQSAPGRAEAADARLCRVSEEPHGHPRADDRYLRRRVGRLRAVSKLPAIDGASWRHGSLMSETSGARRRCRAGIRGAAPARDRRLPAPVAPPGRAGCAP